MAGKHYASLQSIRNDRPITAEQDAPFLYHLQTALLLALKEQGILNEMPYRSAEEKLRRQWRDLLPGGQEERRVP